MAKKQFEAVYTVVVTKVIEAENEGEAIDIARNLSVRDMIINGNESQYSADFDYLEMDEDDV